MRSTPRERVRRARSPQATFALLSVSAIVVVAAAVLVLWMDRVPRSDVAAPATVGAERLFILDMAPGGKASEGAVLEVRAGSAEAAPVRRYPLGSDPDAVLSPDGDRLYGVAHVWLSNIKTDDRLRVFDTSNGELLNEAPVPDWQGTHGFHITNKVAVARDGGHVYVLVGFPNSAPGRPQSLATYDVTSGIMLPEVASLGGCGAGPIILPLSGSTVVVVCPQTNEVRFLAIAGSGAVEGSEILKLSVESDAFVSGAALAPSAETVYVVGLNGLVLEIDTASRRVVSETPLSLPDGYVVATPLVKISPNGGSLFVGLSRTSQYIPRADVLMEVSVSTWRQEAESVDTFSAFEPASDGSRIFMMNLMMNAGRSPIGQSATDPAGVVGELGSFGHDPQAIYVAPTP